MSVISTCNVSVRVLLFIVTPQVDKHIRRLDTDLARFEADLKEKKIESTDYDSTSSKGIKSKFCSGTLC
jgi:5-methylcytosine-specific restriction endonuclease McrBC GTP-binding regulatory subunit McrB